MGSWYWWLMVPCLVFQVIAWKTEFPRDTYRWLTFSHLCLGAYAAGSFVSIASSNPMPLALFSLLMLALAFVAGAVAGVYCIRWLRTPPGPPQFPPPIAMMCPRCDEVTRDVLETYHHVRLMHPDWHEELLDAATRAAREDEHD